MRSGHSTEPDLYAKDSRFNPWHSPLKGSLSNPQCVALSQDSHLRKGNNMKPRLLHSAKHLLANTSSGEGQRQRSGMCLGLVMPHLAAAPTFIWLVSHGSSEDGKESISGRQGLWELKWPQLKEGLLQLWHSSVAQ